MQVQYPNKILYNDNVKLVKQRGGQRNRPLCGQGRLPLHPFRPCRGHCMRRRRTAAGAGVSRLRARARAFRSPLQPSGALAGHFMCAGVAQPLGVQGSALRGGQGLSARPCNLRVPLRSILCAGQRTAAGAGVPRLRARARAFRSPLQPSGVAFLGGVGMASRARSTGKSSGATARGGVMMC